MYVWCRSTHYPKSFKCFPPSLTFLWARAVTSLSLAFLTNDSHPTLMIPIKVMPGGYPNGHGVYSPAQNQYSTSGFHPSNPFYCADPQRPAPGPYPNQGCPAEQSNGPAGQSHSQHQHHHYAGPHCQGVSSQ